MPTDYQQREHPRCPGVLRHLAGTLFLLWCLGGSLESESVAQSLCASRLPSLPESVSNNAVTSVDHGNGTFSLLSFMGLTGPNFASATSAAYRLDLPGGAWTQIADAPRRNNRAKVAANAITVGGQVYVQGGYTISRTDEFTEERLFRYDLEFDTYTEVAPPPVPVDDTVSAVFQDRYIYLISGWNGPSLDNTKTVQFYDTQTNTWSIATDLPGPHSGLFGHSGTIVGDRVVVFDGTQSDGGFSISDAVFVGQIDPLGTGDLSNIAWTEWGAHPGEPTYRAAVSQGGVNDEQLLLLGGTSNPYNFNGNGYNGSPSLPLNQALLFDVQSATWTPIDVTGSVLPTMDHRGLVRVPDGWATIGGMVDSGVMTDQVVKYEFQAVGTLCVPEPGSAILVWFGAISFFTRRR